MPACDDVPQTVRINPKRQSAARESAKRHRSAVFVGGACPVVVANHADEPIPTVEDKRAFLCKKA